MLARILSLIVALLVAAPAPAQDAAANLAVVIVSTGYNSTDTSIVLTSGHGARLPTAPYNCAWYNSTDYPGGLNSSGTIDPNYEIVRVTARSTDTLTALRGQEGTSGSTKNTAGKTYVMSCGLTALRFTNLNDAVISPLVTIGAASGLANERALTGTSNQITVTDNGAGSTVVLSTPQNIHTAATPTFASMTLSGTSAINLSGTGVTVANGSNGRLVFDTSNRQLQFHPGSEARPLMQLEDAIASGGTNRTDTRLTLWGRSGTGAVANFFTAQLNFGAIDGSSAAASYGIGSDGQWTAGGGFTAASTQWWLYDVATDLHVLRHQLTDPYRLEVGDTITNKGVELRVKGRDISTNADGTVAALNLGAAYTKNDSNTRQFYHAQAKPTLNFGGSNANTTVNVLDIDTTNTATTGAAVNLFKASYGGAARLNLSSAGVLALTGSQTITSTSGVPLTVTSDASTPVVELFVNAVTGAGFNYRRGRGTAASPFRLQSGDTLMAFGAAGYYNDTDNTSAGTLGSNAARFRAITKENFTSTGRGTYMDFGTVPVGATGIVDRMTIGAEKALTDNSATSVVSATVVSGSSTGGIISYTIEATDGTDYQIETGMAVWSAVNKGGTVTSTVTEVNSQQAVSGGTLTTAWTIDTNNPTVISVNANTSLSPSAGYPRITFKVDNLARQAFTLP